MARSQKSDPAETRIVVTVLVCPGWTAFVRTLASWALLRYQARHAPGFIDAALRVRFWSRTVVMFSVWENVHAVRAYAASTRMHLGAIRWIRRQGGAIWSRTFSVEQVSFASRHVVWKAGGLSKLHST